MNRQFNGYAMLVVALTTMAAGGCEAMPREPGLRGAVIGGGIGAVSGAIIDDSIRGVAIGGVVGAGIGYIVGAETERRGHAWADDIPVDEALAGWQFDPFPAGPAGEPAAAARRDRQPFSLAP